MMSLKEIVRHPVTALTAVLSSLASLFQIPFIDAVFAVVWSQIQVLFTAMSVIAFSVFPNLEVAFLQPLMGSTRVLAVLFGVAYALKLLGQVFDQVQARLNE